MVKVLAVGRLKAGPERELFERYWQRSKPFAKTLGFGSPDLWEGRESQAGSSDQRKREEADALLGKCGARCARIVFDERGKTLSTSDLSGKLAAWRDAGRVPTFIIGGPDGLHQDVRASADVVVSFGAMTLPHQLVRVLAAEQIYRCLSVLAGHPYHRE